MSRSTRIGRHPIIVDAGPLIAIANAADRWHDICLEWLNTVNTQKLIVPAMVLAEVCYTIDARQGASTEAEFLRAFAESEQFTLWAPDRAALTRMALLVQQYHDWPLGGTDASVVAAAEHYTTPYVATVDRRHFRAIVPRHVECFTLHPEREPN
jgi:hypothetical protein